MQALAEVQAEIAVPAGAHPERDFRDAHGRAAGAGEKGAAEREQRVQERQSQARERRQQKRQ